MGNILDKLSKIFGMRAGDEDTADRMLRLQEKHALTGTGPVDPITEWRDDTAFLRQLVAENNAHQMKRAAERQRAHEVAVVEIAGIVGQGTSKSTIAPRTARFQRQPRG
ncbi:MAG TPA: hypothetical protein VEF76_07910 [Patescibacteria group bacterium]|nr:hypothetical protein [Patescibacteria group bacterium]